MAQFTRGKFQFEELGSSATKTFRSFQPPEKVEKWTRSAFSDRLMVAAIIGWSVPLLLIAAFTALNYTELPWTIPLYYSRNWGDMQLAKTQFIFMPLAGAFILGLINLGAAVALHKKERVSAYILAGIALLISILASYTVYNIVALLR